jgi:hypothetical protein
MSQKHPEQIQCNLPGFGVIRAEGNDYLETFGHPAPQGRETLWEQEGNKFWRGQKQTTPYDDGWTVECGVGFTAPNLFFWMRKELMTTKGKDCHSAKAWWFLSLHLCKGQRYLVTLY